MCLWALLLLEVVPAQFYRTPHDKDQDQDRQRDRERDQYHARTDPREHPRDAGYHISYIPKPKHMEAPHEVNQFKQSLDWLEF